VSGSSSDGDELVELSGIDIPIHLSSVDEGSVWDGGGILDGDRDLVDESAGRGLEFVGDLGSSRDRDDRSGGGSSINSSEGDQGCSKYSSSVVDSSLEGRCSSDVLDSPSLANATRFS